MDAQEYLTELAQVNRNGFGFLLAYGFTWVVAAALGRRFGPKVGSYAALFQGMVGLPLGLVLTMAAAEGARPEDAALNALSFYLSTGQLLVLPLAVVLVVKERWSMAVATLAVVLAVHFVPYAWLYGTPVYLVVAAVVAVGTAVVVVRAGAERAAVPATSLLVGVTLLAGGAAALAT